MSTPTSLSVHNSRKIFLANANVRGILAIYKPDPLDSNRPKEERQFFKTFDRTIGVGDYLVVPSDTRHNMTTVKCVAVDVEVDLANPSPVKWVIGKIDRAAFDRVVEKEAEMLNMIAAAEKRKMVDELKATVFGSVDETKIKTLAIASMGGDPQIEGKSS